MANPTNFWKNYEYLCNKKGVSVYKAAADCGVKGTGTVSYWRRGSKPNTDNLNAMIEYFGVSAYDLVYDDLEARENAASRAAQAADDPLYAAIMKLSPQQRAVAMAFVAGLNANSDKPF